jgi:hypothetical protein
MRLTRTGEPFTYERNGKSYTGQYGLLVIGPRAWQTVENWAVDTKLLPDDYQCEFGYWTSRSGRKSKAIRILLTEEQFQKIYPPEAQKEAIRKSGKQGARGRIYIHPGNYPNDVEGCVAPGRHRIKNGVGESVLATQEIFDALGGWELGKRFVLEVR